MTCQSQNRGTCSVGVALSSYLLTAPISYVGVCTRLRISHSNNNCIVWLSTLLCHQTATHKVCTLPTIWWIRIVMVIGMVLVVDVIESTRWKIRSVVLDCGNRALARRPRTKLYERWFFRPMLLNDSNENDKEPSNNGHSCMRRTSTHVSSGVYCRFVWLSDGWRILISHSSSAHLFSFVLVYISFWFDQQSIEGFNSSYQFFFHCLFHHHADGFVTPHCRTRHSNSQTETFGAKPQFLFYGYQMPRMLSNYHCI